MAGKISMPKLSDTMTEGKLIRWHKKEGEDIKPGDVLAEVETDKANMDLESFERGTLLKCLVREGEKVRVGAVLAVVGARNENIDAILKEAQSEPPAAVAKADKPAAAAAAPVPVPAAIPASKPVSAPRAAPAQIPAAQPISGGIRVSPVASKLAAEHGIPLAGVRGSGPGGRVVRADIEKIVREGLNFPVRRESDAAVFQIQNKLSENLVPLDGMRKVIAERMSKAKQTIPHFYLQDSMPMDRVVGMRAALNSREGQVRLSFNDFVMMAITRARMMNPAVNATFDGVGIHTHGTVDLAFAVALEGGLITPVLKSCERMSLSEIHAASEELADRARRLKLRPEEYLGGTFTISNLGMYGLQNFAPVINPPQAAILAVAAVQQEPCVDAHGHLYAGWRMGVTLACDHRVLDGAVGAAFLRDLKQILAQPEAWAV